MFGSYRINDPKEDRDPRLQLTFCNGQVYFYSCSLLFAADEYYNAVDQQTDLMSKKWNLKHVLKLMEKKKTSYLCDLFLDQTVFTGSGNIVKNEVLFNIRRHPLTRLSQIARKDWPELASAVHKYCLNFYHWKKRFELRQHWQVYRQRTCPLCATKITREKVGHWMRQSFFCPRHQAPPTQRSKTRALKVHAVLPLKTTPAKESRLDH
jgi:endonuclease-8